MAIEHTKFSVKVDGVEVILEFQLHNAGGGEYFYFMDGITYRYDSIRKEIFTLSWGNKTVCFTDVKHTK